MELKISNKNLAKAIMALVNNRKKILSKGTHKHATFFLGDITILLAEREVVIGETTYKLPKPK